ncbi:uncharacterized protein N0V89_001837 [Didymosphaeria variabile]|uniref:RING-type domain-containing protein n=1 Tax=Didymosphaeria variabile TaxID=1932322 RepID=A0A9W9CDT5_9PLEO|nr:uncharacterized protein N0V89_001837 [Didymosphaeria variabile]KAJ4357262.1 hypothetical protein N0V89_001837 [Didymosphaeria variabile]
MADYPTREEFAWSGMEQLSKVPVGGDDECPICKTLLVSNATPPTKTTLAHQLVHLHNPPTSQNGESSNTTILTDSTSDTGVPIVHVAHAPSMMPPPTFGPIDMSVRLATENLVATFIRIRACGHIYHTACLREWLSVPQNKTCPMCRRVLFDAPYGPEAATQIGNLQTAITTTRHDTIDYLLHLRNTINEDQRESERLAAVVGDQKDMIKQLRENNAVLLHRGTAAMKQVVKLKRTELKLRKQILEGSNIKIYGIGLILALLLYACYYS